MSTFQSKWLTYEIGTDETDESTSVSFVSDIPRRVEREKDDARAHGMPLGNVVDITETGKAAKISANAHYNGTDETDRSGAVPRWREDGRVWICVCGPWVNVIASEPRCVLCGAARPEKAGSDISVIAAGIRRLTGGSPCS